MPTLDRPKIVARISEGLCRTSYPRFEMTLIVLATGLAGFGASVLMLHLGLGRMWIRYPLAVTISYGAFFLLLRLWIARRRQERSVTKDLLDASDIFDSTDLIPSGRGSSHLSSDIGGS